MRKYRLMENDGRFCKELFIIEDCENLEEATSVCKNYGIIVDGEKYQLIASN